MVNLGGQALGISNDRYVEAAAATARNGGCNFRLHPSGHHDDAVSTGQQGKIDLPLEKGQPKHIHTSRYRARIGGLQGG